MSERNDRRLGMGCPITRRDFLNGVAIGAGGLVASDPMLAALLSEETAPEKAPGYYPPALTGMRGNHDGTFTYAHKLRDGKRWDATGGATETGETYDLVVEASAGWRRPIFTARARGKIRAFWFWIITTILAGMRSAMNFRPAGACC